MASNVWGKTGLIGRGLLDFIVAPAAIAKGVAAVSRKLATAGEVGTVATNVAGRAERSNPVGNATRVIETAETTTHPLTRAEKLAQRPNYIEQERWEELVNKYPELKPEHLQKAFEIENFLAKNKVPNIYWLNEVHAFDLDTVRLGSELEAVLVHRYYGEGKEAVGYYVTEHLIPDTRERIRQLALPPNNPATEHAILELQKGTPTIRGKVAPNHGQPGGGDQIYVPNLDNLRKNP